jgi:enoyl-CoA hydratase
VDYQAIVYETQASIATISLNRPRVLNAINRQMIQELGQALDAAQADPAVRAVILRGNGRAFCAGFDLKEEAGDAAAGPAEWLPRFKADWDIFLKIWRLDKPVVAAVQGYCLAGAMELLLACDLAVAAEGTQLGFPEIRHGAGPGIGLLVYAIGSLKTAKELLLLGESIEAADAQRIGLINRVVPADQLDASTQDLARRLALIPETAMAVTKRYINSASEAMGLDQTVEYGTVLCALLTGSQEYIHAEATRRAVAAQSLKDYFKQRDAAFKGSV